VGLPPQGTDYWDIFRPLLADRALAPTKADILNASAHFLELLQIRRSSSLFRLQTADQVKGVVSFYNTGPELIPGLIVMRLRDTGNYDPNVNDMVVLFNASPEPVTFSNNEFIGLDFALNSVQQVSNDALIRDSQFDPGTGSFSVAGRTTAVFTILGEPEIFPTPTATTVPVPTTSPSTTPTAAPPASSSPTGVVALAVALVAAIGAGIAWLVRRGRKE
jgi:hypothetical protein